VLNGTYMCQVRVDVSCVVSTFRVQFSPLELNWRSWNNTHTTHLSVTGAMSR